MLPILVRISKAIEKHGVPYALVGGYAVALHDITPIVDFLEMFRELSDPRARNPQKLIGLKVPEPLLAAFRFKAKQLGAPYQTMIKRLMVDWLKLHNSK